MSNHDDSAMPASRHTEALAVFEHAADEIRFFKAQQWKVANYCLLAQAALVLIPTHLDNATNPTILMVVSIIVGILTGMRTWVAIRQLDGAIDKERERLADARKALRFVSEIHERRQKHPGDNTAGVLQIVVLVATCLSASVNTLNVVAYSKGPSTEMSGAANDAVMPASSRA